MRKSVDWLCRHFALSLSLTAVLPSGFRSSSNPFPRVLGSTSDKGAKSSCLKIIKRYNRSTKNKFRENYSMLKDDIITKNKNLKIKNTEEQSV